MLDQIVEVLRTPAAFIFVLGIVIFVHELGHFLAAKWAGVYAPRFSIGFGPALWSRKWGDTEYVVAAFPLGGYVRMASREDEPVAFLEGGAETPAPASDASEAPDVHLEGGNNARVLSEKRTVKLPRHYDPNGIAPFGPNPVPENRLFESKPLYKRLVIMLAGVTFNFLLAVLVFSIEFGVWGNPVLTTRVIGNVQDIPGVPQVAEKLAEGDSIIAVNGAPVESWNDVLKGMRDQSVDTVSIRTTGGEVHIPIGSGGMEERSRLAAAVQPMSPAVIGTVVSGRPAAKGGLEAGDSIVRVNGQPTNDWFELVAVIERSAGQPVKLDVMRDGALRHITVTPEPATEQDPVADTARTVGKIGALNEPGYEFEHVAIPTAVAGGLRESLAFTGLVLGALRDFVTGATSVKDLGGVVQIAGQSGEAAKAGFEVLLRFLAIISINLAVFNLLPIPILDGGQIALNITESARGKAFSERTRAMIAYVGLSAIAVIFLLSVFNDLTRGL
jgi:regulator of sigma E protease